MSTITILDYGAGNLTSVRLACERFGYDTRIATTAGEAPAEGAVIFPGDGSAKSCLEAVRARGYDRYLRSAIEAGRPVLGICIGMQLLFDWSAEDGAKLCEDIARAYESEGGHDRYWEQVPLVFFKDRYKVAVRECRAEDIVEIDTFDELCQLDPSYKEYGKK